MYQTLTHDPAADPDALLIPTGPADLPDDAPPEFSGRLGDVAALSADAAPRRILIGLGDHPEQQQAVQAAAFHAIEKLDAAGAVAAQFDEKMNEHLIAAFTEGMALAAFRFTDFATPAEAEPASLTIATASEAVPAALARAASVNHARRLAALPAHVATPEYLANKTRHLARNHETLRCTVYHGGALEQYEFVGLLTVGRASEHAPALIELVYEPEDADDDTPTIALVGKTITYDAGGLSIKIHDSMRTMKYDKCGGVAVLGAMRAIAEAGPDVRVIGLMPAAENAISHTAFRPDDVIRYPNGVNVEITNTDFEGRLVMADALIHACREHDPDAVIDLGTLTGEIIEVLGKHTAGLWTHDAALREAIESAAAASGDAVWPMPLLDEHRDYLKSDYAHIVNRALDQPGKSCQCAAFLEHFVEGDVRWAHLDIAGPVFVTSTTPPYVPGATGYGVRLLTDLILNWN